MYLQNDRGWWNNCCFFYTGFLFQGVFLIVVGYSESKHVAVFGLTMAVGFGGLAWSGFIINHLDIAPRYASLLLGISNCFATIPGIISPLVVGFVTTNEVGLMYSSYTAFRRHFSLQLLLLYV